MEDKYLFGMGATIGGFQKLYMHKDEQTWKSRFEGVNLKNAFLQRDMSILKLSAISVRDVNFETNTYPVHRSDSLSYKDFGKYSFLGPYLAARKRKPKRLSRNQLIEVIRNGDDSIDNKLVVDLEGNFRLVPKCVIDINWCIYPVLHETFHAYHNYVGPEAAIHEKFIDDNLKYSLSLWNMHLKTGCLGVLFDHMPEPDMSIDVLRVKEKAIRTKLKTNPKLQLD